jgi:predicted phosphodiesterase
MRVRVRLGAFVTLSMVIVTASCVSWVGRYGEPFQTNGDPTYYPKLIGGLVGGWSGKVAPVMVDDSQLVVTDPAASKQPGFKDQCLAGKSIFSFVWLSDVQLRQRNVKLGSAQASHDLRAVIPSFESDPMQEEYGWAVYLSHVLAINQLAANWTASANDPDEHKRHSPPGFVIHTGDSIDSGTVEELYHYISISNYMTIPWLNVFGNHDTAVFGNYSKAKSYSLDSNVEFYPVARRPTWLFMHNPDKNFAGFGRELLPVPTNLLGMSGHLPTQTNSTGVLRRPSFCHGFDLTVDQPHLDQPDVYNQLNDVTQAGIDCSTMRGYYAFDVNEKVGVPVRVIALDSPFKDGKWGDDAELGEEQVAWLDRVLTGTENRLVFVFAHHPAQLLEAPAQAVLLRHANNNLVYFSGHTHANHLFAMTDGKKRFYDLNNGAVMQYPQLGRVVELRSMPGAGGQPNTCLVSRWLWPDTLSPSLDAMIKETQSPHPKPGRILSDSDEIRLSNCDTSRMLMRPNLSDATNCGHLGSLRDYHREYTFKNAPEWGRPQPFSEARAEANIIIPLELPH